MHIYVYIIFMLVLYLLIYIYYIQINKYDTIIPKNLNQLLTI